MRFVLWYIYNIAYNHKNGKFHIEADGNNMEEASEWSEL